MAKFIVFFLVCLSHSLFASVAKKNKCDYSFGNSTWTYSKIFYDHQIKFPAGEQTHAVIIPSPKGRMISYVCITFPSTVDKDNIMADYNALSREVSVMLARPETNDFKYHLVAKHGY